MNVKKKHEALHEDNKRNKRNNESGKEKYLWLKWSKAGEKKKSLMIHADMRMEIHLIPPEWGLDNTLCNT